jgi:3-oxoacyl-[acyl-carrier protein] reductase
MSLEGKTAIITGSGRGIGREIALRLAADGADIVINDVGDLAPAEAVAAEVTALGRKSLVVAADVSNSDEVAAMVEKAVAEMGRVDILVNNAGITRDQLIMRMSDDDWDKVLGINLKGVFVCTRAVLRPMIRQRSGTIVNIASIVGLIGNAGQANYSAAKAGIIGLTKTTAKEAASRGITANAVAPGFIDTPMTQALPDQRREELKKQVLLGSLGTPADVAGAVAFLVSEDARYITGQVITVDGGISLGKL